MYSLIVSLKVSYKPFAIKGFTMLTTGITNASIRLNEFNSALKLVKAGNIGENELQMLAKMTANLSQSQLKAVISSKALSTEQRIAILTAQGLSKSEAEAALSSMGLAAAEGAATTTTFTLSGALKGLWATLMANPLILVVAKNKLGLDSSEIAEIIDLRIRPEKIEELLSKENYYPGWHMNKKNWYTIILDGSIKTEEIYKCIDESYCLAL